MCGLGCENCTRAPGRESRNLAHIFSSISVHHVIERSRRRHGVEWRCIVSSLSSSLLRDRGGLTDPKVSRVIRSIHYDHRSLFCEMRLPQTQLARCVQTTIFPFRIRVSLKMILAAVAVARPCLMSFHISQRVCTTLEECIIQPKSSFCSSV